jgi:NTP pyrophosphatase (non-canonical NTP hydrolase)
VINRKTALEIIKELKEEHRKIFGDLDEKSQFRKIGEEIGEFLDRLFSFDKEHTKEEACDCLIVCMGLLNTLEKNESTGLFIFNSIIDILEKLHIFDYIEYKNVIKKMETNSKRTLTIEDGVIYHK